MSLDISQLSAWNDVDNSLTVKAITSNKFTSIPGMHLVPDVKGSVEVPFLTSTPIFTSIKCSTTSTGTTTLGNRTVQTGYCNLREEICAGEIQGSVLSKYMKNLNDLPFEDQIAQETALQIEKFVEDQCINGLTTGYKGVTVPGLLQLLNSASASTINVTASALTNTTAIQILDTYLANQLAVMTEMKELVCLVDVAGYRALNVQLRNLDYVNFKTEANTEMVVSLPGYANVTVRAIPSFPSSKCIITYPENLIFAYNMNGGLIMEYDKKDKVYWKDADFRLGVQVHFPDHVIYAK